MSHTNVVGLHNKVVDLHPEDLLERDASGDLDESERARLDAHLERCATCRFERQLRGDFAEELEADGPALTPAAFFAEVAVTAAAPPVRQPGAVASTTRLMDQPERVAAPLAVPAPLAVAAPLPAVRRPYARRRTAKALWLLAAAALLLLAGGAAAAMGLGMRHWPGVKVAETPAPAEPGPGTAHSKLHRQTIAPEPTTDVVAPVETTATIPLVLQAAAPPAVARASSEVGPGQLFDGEVEARRHGDYARVLELHRQLVQRFGGSREAQVSRATVGRLLLDRNDPGGALANFDAYLRAGSGDIAEEAMVGRANALERLGRRDDAKLAWSALVAAFPGTAYAAHAKARIASADGD